MTIGEIKTAISLAHEDAVGRGLRPTVAYVSEEAWHALEVDTAYVDQLGHPAGKWLSVWTDFGHLSVRSSNHLVGLQVDVI